MARTRRRSPVDRESRWDDADVIPLRPAWRRYDPDGEFAAQLEQACPFHASDATLGIDRTPPAMTIEQAWALCEARGLVPPLDPADSPIYRAELTVIAGGLA